MKYDYITTDTFDIAKRLKEIDPHYLLKWNKQKKRYEVFFKEEECEQLELIIPFNELDIRSLYLVQKTRIENAKKILKELEEHNEKLEKKLQNKVLDETYIKTKELTKYVFQKGDTTSVNFENSYKTKWV